MKITEIIVEGYKEAQIEFSKVVDSNSAQQVINQYKELVQRNQVQGQERNIDFWRKQGWDAFQKFVSGKINEPSKTQVKRKKVVGKSINLIDNDQWLVVVPLDKDASCFHGKNSDWCTTKTNQPYYEEYFYDQGVTLIYCLNKKTGGMWAIAAHKDIDEIEMFDQRDNSINENEFQHQTGLNPRDLVGMVLGAQHKPSIHSARETYIQAKEDIIKFLDGFNHGKRNGDIEKKLLFVKDASLCYQYITTCGHNDYQDDLIVLATKVSSTAVAYASNITEKLAREVVKIDGNALRYIPSDKITPRIEIEAVKQNGIAIAYVENPSEELQKVAVTNDNATDSPIKYINNPSHEIKKLSVETKPASVRHINIDDIESEEEYFELWKIAIEKRPSLLQFMEIRNDEITKMAVSIDPWVISDINDPSIDLMLQAVKQDPRVLSRLKHKHPPFIVEYEACKRNPHMFTYANDPNALAKWMIERGLTLN